MHVVNRQWSVARKQGERLLLARTPAGDPTFAGMSHNTVFIPPGQFGEEMRRLHIDPDSVVETPVEAEFRVG